MPNEWYCKYGCGKKVVWSPHSKMPVEYDENFNVASTMQHTFKRCAELQQEQGRKAFFFDRVPKK